MATEEEIRRFVSENKALIESMMQLQREGMTEAASVARDSAKDAAAFMKDSAEDAMSRAEDLAKATFGMFTDPEVQRHFVAMGLEFMMGLSAMMQKAPIPDFMKDSADSAGKAVRTAACRANEDCGARKVQKVDINVDDGPEKIEIGE